MPYCISYWYVLCSLVLPSFFLPSSLLARNVAARRWPSLRTNDGQHHGGAAKTNTSTGTPRRALPIHHRKKYTMPRQANHIIFVNAPPLGQHETSSPMRTAGGRFLWTMNYQPPTIINKYNEYEVHSRRSVAANNIILPPPSTNNPPLQTHSKQKPSTSDYNVTPNRDTFNSQRGRSSTSKGGNAESIKKGGEQREQSGK